MRKNLEIFVGRFYYGDRRRKEIGSKEDPTFERENKIPIAPSITSSLAHRSQQQAVRSPTRHTNVANNVVIASIHHIIGVVFSYLAAAAFLPLPERATADAGDVSHA